MDEHHCRRNIVLYRIYVAFNEPLFWGPILILSLQSLAHMSLPDIYYMESVVLCVCVVLDIPSGALADITARRNTTVIGRVFLLASSVGFALMQSPRDAWIANVVWSIGYSLQSGADTALLYDTLQGCGIAEQYKRIDGRAVGARLILMGLCGLVTGFLATIDPRLPLYLVIPFMSISLVAAMFFVEPKKTKHYSVAAQFSLLREGVGFVATSPAVRWMVVFAALLATTSKIWFFTYNPYFELVHLPLSYYGVIFLLLNAVAWVSSHYAHDIEERIGEGGSIILMVLCLGMPIIAMGLVPAWPSAFLVIIQNVVRGFMRPFVGDYLHRHVASTIRATVISTQSSVANLVSIVALAVFGYLTATVELLTSLTILGIIMIVAGAYAHRYYLRRIA